MNCEQAILLISARIDGESNADDQTRLDAHLAECESCRQRLSETEIQDAALLRAFAPRQQLADAVAAQISGSILWNTGIHEPRHDRPFKRISRQLAWAMAAAILVFVAGIMVEHRHYAPPVVFRPAAGIPSSRPIAHLTFATGNVFVCPADQHVWTALRPHDAIAPGAAVRTDDVAKCELQTDEGYCLRLNSATEAKFDADRSIKVSAGELWSAVPKNSAPLCVSAGKTTVVAGGADEKSSAEFALACVSGSANVTVQRGTASVGQGGKSAMVRSGQMLHASTPAAATACTVVDDALSATLWQDDLLTLKPPDDPEVTARIEQLLSRATADSAKASGISSAEARIRSKGPAWCPAMASYLRRPPPGATPVVRRVAGKLLADLASPTSIPDLIELLNDTDHEIRKDSARALYRLTGQTLGVSTATLDSGPNPEGYAAWRQWWLDNKSRYPARAPSSE